jgi:hypothetical protein
MFFACMFGPITGNRNDLYMLAMSGLIPKLQEIMPPPLPAKVNDHNIVQNDAGIFSLYGNPAYPQWFLLF